MRAGRLNHRVTLEQRSISRSDVGGRTVSYTPVATVYAEVAPLRGEEFFAAKTMVSKVNVKITIRYRSDVAPDWRISMDDADRGKRTFGIDAVVNPRDGRNILELMCKEFVSGEPV